MNNSTIPNVNDPEVRTKMLMTSADKCHIKLKEIAKQKNLLECGIPCEYDSMEELSVEVDFVIKKLNSLLAEIRFVGLMRRLNMPYSLN